jgi:hypothetical protein
VAVALVYGFEGGAGLSAVSEDVGGAGVSDVGRIRGGDCLHAAPRR